MGGLLFCNCWSNGDDGEWGNEWVVGEQVCLNLTASPWQRESSPSHTYSSVWLGDYISHALCIVQLGDIHFMYSV